MRTQRTDAAAQRASDLATENLAESPNWEACDSDDALLHPAPGTEGWCVSFDDDVSPTKVRVVIRPESQPALFGALFGAERLHRHGVGRGRDPAERRSQSAWARASPTGVPEPPPGDVAFGTPPPPAFFGDTMDCPAQPGVYHDIRLDAADDCDLLPGAYVVLGELIVPFGAEIFGEDVTIYLGCGDDLGIIRACADEEGGRILGELGSRLRLEGDAGIVPGLALMSDPGNTAMSHLPTTWEIDGYWIAAGERESPPGDGGLLR